jgi:spore maturation protein CgeB
MKALCVLGQHNYGDPARGLGYEYVNFLPALRRLGWAVTVFESLDRNRYSDFAEMNRMLVEVVQREEPDLLFCVLLGYEVWTETLDLIRSAGRALVINWGTDDSWKYEGFSRYLAPHVDVWATTSEAAVVQARRDGHDNVVQTQWAASRDFLAEPLPASQCRRAVTFVGSAYGNRIGWVNALRARGIEIECFGHGWPAGSVSAEEVLHIYRDSVLTLNFGDSGLHLKGLKPYRSRQIKARVFEVTGAGGCLLTEDAEHLDAYFAPGREILLFSSPDDLARSVRRYLDNPRERDAIARAGHERTRREHVYDERFTRLIEEVRRILQTESREPRIGWGEALSQIDRLVQAHRQRGGLVWLRRGLAGPGRLLWGARRGPRAARRLLHEISWRLMGARTYSARGLPGRLFYQES